LPAENTSRALFFHREVTTERCSTSKYSPFSLKKYSSYCFCPYLRVCTVIYNYLASRAMIVGIVPPWRNCIDTTIGYRKHITRFQSSEQGQILSQHILIAVFPVSQASRNDDVADCPGYQGHPSRKSVLGHCINAFPLQSTCFTIDNKDSKRTVYALVFECISEVARIGVN
jgi:hypothetical protein